MTPLPDEKFRDLITNALDQTLFVEAGAGTGKTTALVSRLVALIRSGVEVECIAAITFTEKAAAELAERVRKELERAAEGDKGYESLTPAERERCRTAVRQLDNAALQTLHSFARKILALYPLEAQLPPELYVLDDVEGVIDFREHWNAFLDELFAEESAVREPLLIGFTLGMRLKDLQRLAQKFHENWDRLGEVEFETCDMPRLSLDEVRGRLDDVFSRRADCYDPADRMLAHLEELEPYYVALREAGGADQLTIARLLAAMPPVAKGVRNKGRRESWSGGVEPIRQLLIEAEEVVTTILADARRASLCAVLPPIRDFVLDYAKERRRDGRIGFQDMLVFAVELLRENADVRRALHERYTHILIDEFQDTDPLQVELASLLAGAPDATPGPWSETIVEPGRLFFVGDPKQSIYRFRRADIGLFNMTRSAFGSTHVPLVTNFRSSPVILDWVNSVFRQLFEHDMAEDRQAEWRDLAPRPLEKGSPKPPRVRVIGGEIEGARADEVRRAEADDIAAAIRYANKVEGMKLSDMAILLPQRTNAPAIERALSDADIPYRVESRSRVFGTQDIRDLLNILAAIDDPTDEVALVAALRSAAFACSDPDLLRHVNAGGRWDYLRPVPEESAESVKRAFAELRYFYDRRWHVGIGALVEEVIVRRRLMELALASLRQRETWRRLRFVAEQARSLENSGVLTTLRQFVEWMRIQVKERAMVQEGAVVEPDDDAVRILTVHAAKGLEFEAVFLAGLGVLPWPDRGEVVVWPERAESERRAEIRLGVKDVYFQTSGYEVAKEREAHHSRLERDRLLYVAATRAKQLLVVSLYRRDQKQPHEIRHAEEDCASAECIAWACEAAGREGETWERYEPQPIRLGFDFEAHQPPPDSPEIRDAWIAERGALFARNQKAPVFAATGLAHADDGEPEDPAGEREREPWRKGRAGTSVGRAVHAVLQTIDLATGEGLEAAARSQAIGEGVADQVERIVRLAENARRSEPVREALISGRYWREVFVAAQVGPALIEGFIDLLYEGPDGYVVVDYKTDSVPDEAAIDRVMERYEIQGATYALALERALGVAVSWVEFVFTEPRAVRPIAALAGAKERALALIERETAVPA